MECYYVINVFDGPRQVNVDRGSHILSNKNEKCYMCECVGAGILRDGSYVGTSVWGSSYDITLIVQTLITGVSLPEVEPSSAIFYDVSEKCYAFATTTSLHLIAKGCSVDEVFEKIFDGQMRIRRLSDYPEIVVETERYRVEVVVDLGIYNGIETNIPVKINSKVLDKLLLLEKLVKIRARLGSSTDTSTIVENWGVVVDALKTVERILVTLNIPA